MNDEMKFKLHNQLEREEREVLCIGGERAAQSTGSLQRAVGRGQGHSHTCLSAFLLCFCEEDSNLLAPGGTEGEEHRVCGEEGWDCNLEGTERHKAQHMAQCDTENTA